MLKDHVVELGKLADEKLKTATLFLNYPAGGYTGQIPLISSCLDVPLIMDNYIAQLCKRIEKLQLKQ